MKLVINDALKSWLYLGLVQSKLLHEWTPLPLEPTYPHLHLNVESDMHLIESIWCKIIDVGKTLKMANVPHNGHFFTLTT
jgi:hypothetical protein